MIKWIIFFASIIIGTIFFKHELILSSYSKFFVINNATPGADAILVLSGGNFTRIPHGLRLYKEGYAPKLLLTEEKKSYQFLSNIFPNKLEIAEAIMIDLNINAPTITIPSIKGGATSTFDEAYDLKKYLKDKNFLKIILVTDAFHTKRALYAFKKVFEDNKIKFEISAAQNEIFNEENWWTSDQGISAYVLESIKYPIYLLTSKNLESIRND